RHPHGVGGDAPGPRRGGLRRPARPGGHLPGRGPAGGVEGRPRGGRPRPRRVRARGDRGGGPSLRGHRQPEDPDRGRGGAGPRDPRALRGAHAAVPDRGRADDVRGHPAQVPLPRSAPAAHAAQHRAAPPRHDGRAHLPRRAGLLRDRDAVPHQVHAGGSARLPRPVAHPPRQLLRAAPVAPDLQADPDGRGSRQVLPDRPLVPRPFPRLTYAEAMERYGSDKPDMRFGMEISDVTEEMSTLGLDTFPGLISAGARARAIVLPAAGGVSGTRLRKINEESWLGRIVPDARASKRNLFNLKATDEAVGNLVKKGAREDVARRLFEKAGAKREDTVLVAVDEPAPLAMSLGILRLEMGRELKIVDDKAYRFLWVTHFPLFEREGASGRLQSVNHPFTAPLDEDIPLLDRDPARARAQAYDIVLNGTEVGGGSIRIHDSALQAKVFKLLSLTDEETRDRFGFFIEALQYGTPPHGGIALGLDRIVMILAGESSLRDVIAFPKTASAADLMSGSPSPVRD